jgi:hypothetical protein
MGYVAFQKKTDLLGRIDRKKYPRLAESSGDIVNFRMTEADGYKINSREDFPKFFAELKFKVGAEVGVLKGEFSELLCKGNPGLKLYCIDAWGIGEKKRREYHLQALEEAKVRLSVYDTVLIHKLSMDAVKDFADESLDFVYIDANHEPSFVREDIREWTKKVKKGGIVSGHDYNLYKITPVIDEYVKNNDFTLHVTTVRSDKTYSWWFLKNKFN